MRIFRESEEILRYAKERDGKLRKTKRKKMGWDEIRMGKKTKGKRKRTRRRGIFSYNSLTLCSLG